MLRALTHALSTWTPDSPPAATWFLPELRTLLRAEFAGAYRPAAIESGWSLDFMYGTGANAPAFSRNFRSYVAGMSATEQFLGHCNPHFVQVAERNRVLPLGTITRDHGDRRKRRCFKRSASWVTTSCGC